MKRLRYLDIARGLGLLLVIISHSCGLSSYLINYYIPLFFVLSGYTYKEGRGYGENISRKAKRLLIPYFGYSAVLLAFYAVTGRTLEETKASAFGILYSRYCLYDTSMFTENTYLFTVANGALWYLTAFFAASLVYHLVIDKCLASRKFLIGCMAVLIGITMVLNQLPILLPWSIDIACVAALFMIVGTLLGRCEFFEKEWNIPLIIGTAIVYIVLSTINPGINMSTREYGVYQTLSIPMFIVIGISGSMLCIWAGKLVQNNIIGKLLEHIGRNTVVLLAFHLLGFEIFTKIYMKLTGVYDIATLEPIPYAVYHAVRIITSVCGCLVLAEIIGRVKRMFQKKREDNLKSSTETKSEKKAEIKSGFKSETKGRNSSIELLRILCLVLVFWMHTSGSYKDNELSAWISIAVTVVANIGVACFILISGYYGIRLNVKKMMHLDLMLIFYCWISLALEIVWGNSLGGEAILSYLLPVIGKYSWYFTCYFALAFLSPFINEMVEKLGELKLKQLIITMLVIFSGVTTLFFFDMNGDGGKGIVHMVMLYLIGRYIAVYQSERVFKTSKLIKIFALTAAVNFALNGALYVVTGTVQNRYARDNSLFIIVQAVCIFLIFRNIYFENSFINRVAKHVPAVFIFEWALRGIVCNYVFDYVTLQQENYYEALLLVVAVVIVAMGTVIDWLRVTLLSKPEKWIVDKAYAVGERLWIRMTKRGQKD